MASVRPGGECVEDVVAEFDLFMSGERAMPEDALVELAGLTDSAASVREREVVEDEQLTGTQADVDLDGVKRQAALSEELKLVGQARELGAAEKSRGPLDAGQDGRLAEGGLDDPCETALDVPRGGFPRAVAVAVGSEAPNQLIAIRPRAAGQQRAQRHESRDRVARRLRGREVQGGEPGYVGRHHGGERESEVDVKGLKVAARRSIRRRDHEVADDLEGSIDRRGDDLLSCAPRLVQPREGTEALAVADGGERAEVFTR